MFKKFPIQSKKHFFLFVARFDQDTALRNFLSQRVFTELRLRERKIEEFLWRSPNKTEISGIFG